MADTKYRCDGCESPVDEADSGAKHFMNRFGKRVDLCGGCCRALFAVLTDGIGKGIVAESAGVATSEGYVMRTPVILATSDEDMRAQFKRAFPDKG